MRRSSMTREGSPAECGRQTCHPQTVAIDVAHDLGDKERYKKTYWSEIKGIVLRRRRRAPGQGWIFLDRWTHRRRANVAGHRLGTAEVESALVSHPAVAEAAVVGRPDDLKGQAVVAFRYCERRTCRSVVRIARGTARARRTCHRRHRQARRHPFRRGAAQDAFRKNHAPLVERNRQRQIGDRRHDHAGRLFDSRQTELLGISGLFFARPAGGFP